MVCASSFSLARVLVGMVKVVMAEGFFTSSLLIAVLEVLVAVSFGVEVVLVLFFAGGVFTTWFLVEPEVVF